MRVLYHFQHSPFSRRTRLLLAHKGLEAELRDGRANEAFVVQARRLTPLRTFPVLEDEGRVVADSGAIAHYLDLAYPDLPLLFPRGADAARDALEVTTLVDVALNAVVDMSTRHWDLRNDPAWGAVCGERMSRGQAAIEAVAKKATRPHLAGEEWTVADIWAYSAVRWVAGWPERLSTNPVIGQLMAVGFRIPEALVAWAKQHDDRKDVQAIYG